MSLPKLHELTVLGILSHRPFDKSSAGHKDRRLRRDPLGEQAVSPVKLKWTIDSFCFLPRSCLVQKGWCSEGRSNCEIENTLGGFWLVRLPQPRGEDQCHKPDGDSSQSAELKAPSRPESDSALLGQETVSFIRNLECTQRLGSFAL